MTRIALSTAALALAAAPAVAAAPAGRAPITQASSGKTFHLARGQSATLRLSNRWWWSEPSVSSRAVALTPVEYFVDPGFREWTIRARRRGLATIRSYGRTNCSTCTLAARPFRVTIVVG
jgi:predicted secreted protein